MTLLAALALCFFLIYGIFRYYSPPLVSYVVEQTLMQKAPEQMSPQAIRERFEAAMSPVASNDKMFKLLSLSNYLEKIQRLTPAEVDELLGPAATARK